MDFCFLSNHAIVFPTSFSVLASIFLPKTKFEEELYSFSFVSGLKKQVWVCFFFLNWVHQGAISKHNRVDLENEF